MNTDNEDYKMGLTLPNLIAIIVFWSKKLLKKWILISIISLIGAGIGLAYAWTKKPKYTATLFFMVEEGKTSSIGAIAGIASQFGINLGGGDDNIFTSNSIVELMKSRKLVEKALLSEGFFNNKKALLINYYIDFNNFRKTWEDEDLSKLQFTSDKSKFTILHDSIMNMVYLRLMQKETSVSKADKKLSLIKVECTTANEEFSKVFTEQWVKALSEYYVEYKTKSARQSLGSMQNRTDSVRTQLYEAEASLASLKDNNMRVIKAAGFLTEARLQRQTEILNIMYIELTKNLEISKMNLLFQTPLIEILDKPILPLEKQRTPKKIGMIAGFFAGFFMTCFGIIFFNIISDAVKINKQQLLTNSK